MYASMPHSTAVSVDRRRLPRDLRVDVLRGIALITIFIDHLPDNPLSLVTLHTFGFCDAAELFVFLSGFSSMVAYGGSFDRDGVLIGLRRVFLRCVRLYLFQAALLLVVFAGPGLHDFAIDPKDAVSHLRNGVDTLRHGLTLQAQPPGLNILPLYIILLGLFPLIYGLIRIGPAVALLASGVLWLGVNLDPSINLPNWPDGGGWYFDPFAWQFLFVIGISSAQLLRRAWRKPASPALAPRYSLGLSRLRANCSGALGGLGLVQSASHRNRYSGQDRPGAAATGQRAGHYCAGARLRSVPRRGRTARAAASGRLRPQFT